MGKKLVLFYVKCLLWVSQGLKPQPQPTVEANTASTWPVITIPYYSTCLTTFNSVALQLHKQGCYSVQWDYQQLTKLWPRRTGERIRRILIGWLSKSIVRQVAKLQKSIKSLQQSLWKVESSSTFCNTCGNKKMCCLSMLHFAHFGCIVGAVLWNGLLIGKKATCCSPCSCPHIAFTFHEYVFQYFKLIMWPLPSYYLKLLKFHIQ